MKLQYLLYFFIPLLSISYTKAQEIDVPEDELNILRLEDLSFGIRLHSQGLALFTDYAKQLTYYKKKLYQFEITEYKNFKENRQLGLVDQKIGYAPPRPYVYGKINNFYLVRALIGRRIQKGEKAEKSGIEIWNTYSFGPSIGLLKPYYINYYTGGTDNGPAITRIKYTGDNKDEFLNQYSIYGAAGFYRGIFESKIVPGLHGKYGYHFDWAPYKDMVRALEVGVMADLYFQRVPILLTETNSFYFLNFYLSVQFGKRW